MYRSKNLAFKFGNLVAMALSSYHPPGTLVSPLSLREDGKMRDLDNKYMFGRSKKN